MSWQNGFWQHSPPFLLHGQEVFISTSIGIAIYPLDCDNSSALLQYADTAMYQAKSKGKSAYHRVTTDMGEISRERLKLDASLRKALENKELSLNYQPIVETATGRLVGAEALLRWEHPVMGRIPPDKFIPLAEETGLIVSIGEWVLETACQATSEWNQKYGLSLCIAINVSPRQFRDQSFVETVKRVLIDIRFRAICSNLKLPKDSCWTTPWKPTKSLTPLINGALGYP